MSDPFVWHDSNGKWRGQFSVIDPHSLGRCASTNFLNEAWEGSGHPCVGFTDTPVAVWPAEQQLLCTPPVITHNCNSTHTSRVWTCPQVRKLQFAPCWKRNMLTRRYILLQPQKLETFSTCMLYIKTYLSCLASNTEISKISVGFNCIFLGGLLLFVNTWKLDLFFVYFLKCCFFFFHSDIPAFLSCFFLVHFSFSLTNKEMLNSICSVDDLFELKCRRKIRKTCQNWNVFQDFCKKKCLWKYFCCLCFLSEDIARNSNRKHGLGYLLKTCWSFILQITIPKCLLVTLVISLPMQVWLYSLMQ